MATYTELDERMTSTLYAAAKRLRDQQTYALPALADMEKIHGKGKPSETGGTQMQLAMSMEDHSSPTQMTTGYEPINLVVSSIGHPGFDAWARTICPVVISGMEEDINRGSHKIYSMVEKRGQNVINMTRRLFHKRLFGLVAGDVLSDWNTWNGDDYADGFIEGVAYGAQNNVVHGFDKNLYAAIANMNNQFYDAAANFSANGLIGLDHLAINIRSLMNDDEGGQEGRDDNTGSKVRAYASLLAFANLKRAVRTNEVYISEKELDAGRLQLAWDGIPITVNRDMPNAGTVTENDPWSFLFVDYAFIYTKWQADRYFKTGTFEKQSGYDVRAAPIVIMGQNACEGWGTSGLMIDGNTW